MLAFLRLSENHGGKIQNIAQCEISEIKRNKPNPRAAQPARAIATAGFLKCNPKSM
jgi:hypothetical protein